MLTSGFPKDGEYTRIPVILDHENATAKIESVKTLYPVLYDYSHFWKEYFWEKQTKMIFELNRYIDSFMIIVIFTIISVIY